MTSKLKAADPTIVDAPSSPGQLPSPPMVSITLRRISGALDPRAIRVKLATVGFQKLTLVTTFVPSSRVCSISCCLDVIYSIAAMKISEIIPIPINKKISVTQ